MNYSNRYFLIATFFSFAKISKFPRKTVRFHYKIIKTILRVTTFERRHPMSRLTRKKKSIILEPRFVDSPMSIRLRSTDPPPGFHSIYFNRDIDDLKPQRRIIAVRCNMTGHVQVSPRPSSVIGTGLTKLPL